MDVFQTAHEHERQNFAFFELGKAQVLLENFEESLNTLEQVLQVATEESERDLEFIVEIESKIAQVMRKVGRESEAVEIERRLASVAEVLNEADAAAPSDTSL
jgi:SpoU rRNA methylase family enzyme